MADKTRRAELLLIFVTLIWGATFSVTKNGYSDASPLLYLGIRFLVAWIAVSLIGFGTFKKINRTNLRDGLILGILMFFGYGFQNLGLSYSTASRTGFITYSFALYVPLLQFLILKKKPHRGNLAGLGLVVIGMVLITGSLGGAVNRGDILTLFSAVAYAFFIVFLDLFSKRSDPAVLTNIQFLVIAALSLGTAPLVEEVYFTATPALFLGIAYLALLGSVVAISLMTRYQKELSPTKAVLIYALEPVFSVFIAVLLFRELFTIREGIGCAVILGGVLLSELWKERISGKKKPLLIDGGE